MLRAAISSHKATAVWAETMSPHPDRHGDSQAMAIHTEGTNWSQEGDLQWQTCYTTSRTDGLQSHGASLKKQRFLPTPHPPTPSPWTRELGSWMGWGGKGRGGEVRRGKERKFAENVFSKALPGFQCLAKHRNFRLHLTLPAQTHSRTCSYFCLSPQQATSWKATGSDLTGWKPLL